MKTEFKPQSRTAANELPPLTDDAKAAIRWMRCRAKEAAEFAGVDDTAGEAIEKLIRMEWGDAANDVFTDGDTEEGEILEGEEINVGQDGAQVEEPSLAMALRRLSLTANDKPTKLQATFLSVASGDDDRRMGQFLLSSPHLLKDPRRELTANEQQQVREVNEAIGNAVADRVFKKKG